ncbi:MAG TPA: hypothetical protein VLN45_08840, partial [Ignavibacteriaceae bacterium]|nr:hypothetical protein [Ignavibacteriaceae bacterium]
MRFLFYFCFIFSFHNFLYPQNQDLEINYNNSNYKIDVKKLHENYYFSFSEFVGELSIPHKILNNGNTIEAEFEQTELLINSGHPYMMLKNKNENQTKIYQLPVSTFIEDKQIYIPLNYSLKALSIAFGKEINLAHSLNLIITSNDISTDNFFNEVSSNEIDNKLAVISQILFYEKSDGIVVRVTSNQKINSYRSFYNKGEFKIILNNSILESDSCIEIKTDFVSDVKNEIENNNLVITLKINIDYNFSDVSEVPGTTDLVIRINVDPDPADWFKVESENFIVLYRESHSALIPHIIRSAESSLKVLMNLFEYNPSEKIIINTYDVSDYGFGTTTTIPRNYIRIEIEPLEPGYENIPYNERLQWLISHELVHIVVNDQGSNIENLSRKIFQKVTPEQVQPITVFYSILTNYSRYTPRWHQEAIAVFLETWLSGGFGRILGNFDEMYFRSMVVDNEEFPSDIRLDAKTTHNSFLIETLFYLYGARFASYLAIKYDSQKLLDWFKISSGDFYHGFKNKFEIVFKKDFDEEWDNFILYEKEFQKKNIDKLNTSETTYIKRIKDEPFGFTTQPHYDPLSETVIFGYHKPHHLSSIQKLDLGTLLTDDIATLPTPSQYQIASTAFDFDTRLFFYTANNNQLYRDVCVLNVETEETKILFKDSRIGHLTVSSKTHELWGVKHSGGKAAIIYSPYPYNSLEQILEFSVGDEIQQLSVNPSGKFIAATLLRSNGQQSLILFDTDSLLSGKPFNLNFITSTGTPENPSWSMDGKILYFNAFTNGVSNIYKFNYEDGISFDIKPTALTHTLRGLFKPIHIGTDLLFAFEFTSEGLIPVIVQDKPAGELPAIQYLGQEVVKKNSIVYNWFVSPLPETSSLKTQTYEEEYNGLENLKIQTFIPVISGFQKQKMLGIYTHISDPLLNHDITIEMGYSPFKENPLGPKWHFKGKYDYKKQWEFGVDHNAPDFYDLFNERKRGLIGTKFRLGHTYFWVYDNPLKIKQLTEVALYINQIFINDNLVRVSEPDFAVAQTIFNSRDLRKTIGSSDFEYGNEFNVTLMFFGANPQKKMEYAGQIFSEWDHFTTFFFPHNVFHFKIAGGYHNPNDNLFQGRFFFGGFGNRALENVEVKQFRKVFRFPGIPIYTLDAEKFVKVMVENNLPP